MNSHHNFRRNRKGIGTVFGMVFFLLIVMIVFASFVLILSQNTGLEQTVIQARQMDNDKAKEQVEISKLYDAALFSVVGNSITVKCNLTNTGTIIVQLNRLWVEDLTTNQSQNGPISVVMRQGQTLNYSSSLTFSTPIKSTDQFRFWFVTTSRK